MGRPRAEQVAQQRRERIKFGDPRLRMSVDPATAEKFKREGLVPRWVNDDKGRVEKLKLRGYDFVRDPNSEVQAGEDNGNTDMGTAVSKVVDHTKDGKPIRAYLMVQRKEDYQEDQDIKELENKRVDDAIRRGEPGGPNQASVHDKHGGTYVKNVEYQP